MLRRLYKLFRLLNTQQQARLIKLQGLVIVTALAEVISVAAIGPFMALVGNINYLEKNNYLQKIYIVSGVQNSSEFLFYMGLLVFLILLVSSLLSILTTWKMLLYAQSIGARISARLFGYYMRKNWSFHALGNSSQYINKVTQETDRVTNTILRPVLLMNAKIVVAVFISIALFIYNPIISLVAVVIFILAYYVLYITVRKSILSNGAAITVSNRNRFQILNEGLGGIKDLIILGRQNGFIERFDAACTAVGNAQGRNMGLSHVPRYVMELVAFGSVILLIIYLLSKHNGEMGDILPVLSVFALGGFKLLPAFQNIYASVAQIKGGLSAFDEIENDLARSDNTDVNFNPWLKDKHIDLKKGIELVDVSYKYENSEENIFKNVGFFIEAKSSIGIIGESGSGKSTLVDIIMGLVEPTSGSVMIDGNKLTYDNIRAWQNSIGYVPQSIFLADSSIRENIAFGTQVEMIDDEKVISALKLASLDEFVARLKKGIDTRVGERGVQLSGGQRQRIGIARALYNDPEILILDEATSALDSTTENAIMDTIKEIHKNKTIIIIAHRLSTIKHCNYVLMLEGGEVYDSIRFGRKINAYIGIQSGAS